MAFDLTRFTAIFKILAVVPVLVGVLSFAELVLPTRKVKTTITDKVASSRIKTNTSTYTLYFGNESEEFDKATFTALNVGDSVQLEMTLFNRNITSVSSDQTTYAVRSTANWAKMFLSLVFLSSGLAWFKNDFLSQKQSVLLLIVIVLGFTQAIKIFFL